MSLSSDAHSDQNAHFLDCSEIRPSGEPDVSAVSEMLECQRSYSKGEKSEFAASEEPVLLEECPADSKAIPKQVIKCSPQKIDLDVHSDNPPEAIDLIPLD